MWPWSCTYFGRKGVGCDPSSRNERYTSSRLQIPRLLWNSCRGRRKRFMDVFGILFFNFNDLYWHAFLKTVAVGPSREAQTTWHDPAVCRWLVTWRWVDGFDTACHKIHCCRLLYFHLRRPTFERAGEKISFPRNFVVDMFHAFLNSHITGVSITIVVPINPVPGVTGGDCQQNGYSVEAGFRQLHR